MTYTAMQQACKNKNYDVPYVVDVNPLGVGATRTPESIFFNLQQN